MKSIDLTDFDDDGFVLHFGGRANEVDALTFGNTLVSIAEAVRAINSEINPGFSLEISIEAVGPGSFRARLKTAKISLRNLFSGSIPRDIIIALLATFIWEKIIDPDTPPIIQINDESVIIQHGNDRIIIPKEAYETKSRVESSQVVSRHIARAMESMDSDQSIESFGIARGLSDPTPIFEIPRNLFAVVRHNSLPRVEEGRRFVGHSVTISVHKAVFERSLRKWEFIWNGFKISAPITDPSFFDKLESRSVAIKQGDAFRATLRVHQNYDKISGNWLNERYEVVKMGELIASRPDQISANFQE